MESHGHDLTGLATLALAALGCGLFMQRLRQPALVGYILAGVLLGPSGLALVENRVAINQLAELGVLLLLFLLGMELSLRAIRQVWKIAFLTTALQINASLGVMLSVTWLLDWPASSGVLLGFVVAISSTAVAVKMLEEIGELRSRIGQVTIGILIAQDLAVVPMMVIVGTSGQEGAGLRAGFSVLLSAVFLVLLIAYLSRRKRIVLPFARLVGKSADLTPLAGLAFCFGAATVSGLLGLSAAYGAFLAGLVIGNSSSRRAMIHRMEPIQAILLMVFFLSIGLLLDVDFVIENIWAVLGLAAFVALFKTGLNVLLLRVLGETWPRAFLCSALLAQIGEFSFVMAALGVSAGSVAPELHRLIVAVTVFSLVVGPIWLEIARRLNRIILLGVTSPRETLRLTLGSQLAWLTRLFSRMPRAGDYGRGQDNMVEMANNATRWMGDIMPRSRRGPNDGPRR